MANSPHPVLLGPLARELEGRGHEVMITSRDHAQTRELSLSIWPTAAIVGGESPGSRLAKGRAIADRVLQLRRIAKASDIDAAASLSSYAQIAAARSLGVPVLTLMDYEYQPANHLSFRLASRVVVPRAFPRDRLRRFGARKRRVSMFDGFKEELYLDGVDDSDGGVDDSHGIEEHQPTRPARVRAVFRPPPEGALYHQAANALFDRVLNAVIARGDVDVIVLPRMAAQRQRYVHMEGVHVPDRAIDGLRVLRSADVFIGAGGTMSREAALLGVRAYTLFGGRLAAVDAELIRRGLLHDLRDKDAADIDWTPRTPAESDAARIQRRERATHLRAWLAGLIEELC